MSICTLAALALPVQRAIKELTAVAQAYHRQRDTADKIVSVALPVLCRTILANPTALASATVDQTLDSNLN